MKRLSDKQQKIYEYIAYISASRGYPPSVREICEAVGLRSPSTVHAHIKTLKDAGYIQKEAHKTRAISIAGEGYARIPIIGRVTAGEPILAVEQVEGYVPFDLGHSAGEHFALNVRGDSMIEAGILDGDIVVVRKQETANHNEIVIAMIEDEATVKRLSRKNGSVWLMPENPAFSPIDGTHAVVIGKVVAVMRKY